MKLINRRVITQSYRKSIQSSEEYSRYKQTDNQRCGLAMRTFVQSPVDRPYKQPIIEQWTDNDMPYAWTCFKTKSDSANSTNKNVYTVYRHVSIQ